MAPLPDGRQSIPVVWPTDIKDLFEEGRKRWRLDHSDRRVVAPKEHRSPIAIPGLGIDYPKIPVFVPHDWNAAEKCFHRQIYAQKIDGVPPAETRNQRREREGRECPRKRRFPSSARTAPIDASLLQARVEDMIRRDGW